MLDPGARSSLAHTRFADVRWHEELDSTNEYLEARAREGAPEGVVVVADHQRAGRGRRGRRWLSPPGSSLLTSVLLRPKLDAGNAPWLTAVAAMAAADACHDVSGVRPELKWPNDLIVEVPEGGERKVGGVLAEVGFESDVPGHVLDDALSYALEYVVVGVGINVNWRDVSPPELSQLAIALDQLVGRPLDRSELLVRFLERLEASYASNGEPGWVDGVAASYRHCCATLGRRVRVELDGRQVIGTATDLTTEGHLVVTTDQGVEQVSAADVMHVR